MRYFFRSVYPRFKLRMEFVHFLLLGALVKVSLLGARLWVALRVGLSENFHINISFYFSFFRICSKFKKKNISFVIKTAKSVAVLTLGGVFSSLFTRFFVFLLGTLLKVSFSYFWALLKIALRLCPNSRKLPHKYFFLFQICKNYAAKFRRI